LSFERTAEKFRWFSRTNTRRRRSFFVDVAVGRPAISTLLMRSLTRENDKKRSPATPAFLQHTSQEPFL
jgi:hypothetical protein